MNNHQKTFVKNFERTHKYAIRRLGKEKLSLGDLIFDVHKFNNPTSETLPEYINKIHPYFYFNFIIDWNAIPEYKLPPQYKSGIEMGREVIREWQKECWKQKYFNYDILSNYDTIDQLDEAVTQVLGNNLTYNSDNKNNDYEALTERLYSIRQAFLDAETQRSQEEIEMLQAQRELDILTNQQREAARKADELRRKQKEAENALQARRNREFSAKKDSPWNKTIEVNDNDNENENYNESAERTKAAHDNENDNDNKTTKQQTNKTTKKQNSATKQQTKTTFTEWIDSVPSGWHRMATDAELTDAIAFFEEMTKQVKNVIAFREAEAEAERMKNEQREAIAKQIAELQAQLNAL